MRFRGGVATVYYILWAGKNGYRYETDAFQSVLDTLATSCLPPSTFFPPEASGGGGGFGTFMWVVVALLLIGLIGVLAFGCHKGWTYPKLTALVRGASIGGRSQTTPTPSFDNPIGPITSPTSTRGGPLAAADSATPYMPPSQP